MKKKAILILLVIAVVTVLAWRWHGQKQTDGEDMREQTETVTETVKTEEAAESETDAEDMDIDVDAYYRERGEVVAVYGVKESERTQTEAEAEEFLQKRGFTQYPVTYDYSIDGEYLDDQETSDSNEKHPMYRTFYMSEAGEAWTITLSNGYIIAYPLSFAAVSERETDLTVSESEIYPGYDAENNNFYEIIPDSSGLTMKIVDRIDAETLDSLTVEVLAAYEE